jgi:cupin superfamily acireductone dioxygenase involved in methionine salvage
MKSYQIAFANKAGKTEEAYKALIVEKMRRRYDINDEIAINNDRDEKPEEYAKYLAYRKQCKEEARAEINAEHTVSVNRVYVPSAQMADGEQTDVAGE